MTNLDTTAVDRFLDAIRVGSVSAADDLYTPNAVLDATVPGWRFAVRGASSISTEYGRWFAAPSTFEELRRYAISAGEVVEYTMAWMEDGVEHAAHHVHVLTLDQAVDRIVEDHVWCGGRWPAPLLAQMDAANVAASG